MKVYVQSVRDPSKKYVVLRFDEATKTATLRGQYAEFEIRPFNKRYLADKGYKLVTEGA